MSSIKKELKQIKKSLKATVHRMKQIGKLNTTQENVNHLAKQWILFSLKKGVLSIHLNPLSRWN